MRNGYSDEATLSAVLVFVLGESGPILKDGEGRGQNGVRVVHLKGYLIAVEEISDGDGDACCWNTVITFVGKVALGHCAFQVDRDFRYVSVLFDAVFVGANFSLVDGTFAHGILRP